MLKMIMIPTVVLAIAAMGTSKSLANDQDLENQDNGSIIPGSYIVTLSSELNQQSLDVGTIEQLANNYAFSLNFLYDSCLKGFAAQMDESTAAALAQNPMVESIEPDRVVSINAQSLPLGINRIDADLSSTKAGDGKGTVTGVDIYIIDTGIQKDHPDLNVVGGVNFNTGKSYDDLNGHGTHVAGIAAAKDNSRSVVGAAPGADLYAVRVLGKDGKGTYAQVIAGINWVTNRKKSNPSRPMVANISLGDHTGSSSYNAMDKAVKNSIDAGVIYAIAAGNEAKRAVNYSPAHVTEALTVGSYDATSNEWASFSNYGSIVDILAPGVDVLSTFKGSSTEILSGTSMSTPHVTGTVALYLSAHPESTSAQVRTALLAAARNPQPDTNQRISKTPRHTTDISVYAGKF